MPNGEEMLPMSNRADARLLDASAPPTPRGDGSVTDKDVLSAVTAEFNQMRAEIGRCQDHQKDMLNLAFVGLGAMLAFIGVVANRPVNERGFAVLLLLVPVLYALLAFACADRARRMLDIAHYVHDDLRLQASALSEQREFWRWEEYKHARYEGLSRPRKLLALTLDKARWLVFFVPSGSALAAYGSLVGFDSRPHALWLGLDVALLVTAFSILLLADETRGLPLAGDARKEVGRSPSA